jgi:hypothetical protein
MKQFGEVGGLSMQNHGRKARVGSIRLKDRWKVQIQIAPVPDNGNAPTAMCMEPATAREFAAHILSVAHLVDSMPNEVAAVKHDAAQTAKINSGIRYEQQRRARDIMQAENEVARLKGQKLPHPEEDF